MNPRNPYDHSAAKGTLVRLGIRNLNGNLRYAAARLMQMRTPEGVAIPPNTMAEVKRDLARLRFIGEQSCAIEKTRVTKLNESPLDQPHAMVLMLAKVRGIDIETADMLVNKVLCRRLREIFPLLEVDRQRSGGASISQFDPNQTLRSPKGLPLALPGARQRRPARVPRA